MSVAVLVLSCDKYAPYWPGWHHFWAKHWKADVPVYFATEARQVPEWPGVKPIYVGRDMTWSGCLFMALSQIPHDTIFFSLEDYWPTQDMGQDLFDELHAEFNSRDLLCLRCSHKSSFSLLESDGIFRPESKFLVSCQTSFWNKNYMLWVLDTNEDAWQFECQGTVRVRDANLAHHVAFHPLPWYAHVCVRGKFVKEHRCLMKDTTLSVPSSLTCSLK